MGTHVITGGTGFVGQALILELLQQTDDNIICLVRPGKEGSERRFFEALRVAIDIYRYDTHLITAAQQQCSVLEADLEMPLCGCYSTSSLGTIEHFWHCAASLRFEEQFREEIERINIEGTQHALDLASRLHAQNFHYISTAYVTGKREGLIPEILHEEHQFNNVYESSKYRAEQLVMATNTFRTRIFRPGIIVGHSRSYGVSGSYTGLYGFIRKLVQFKRLMELANVTSLTDEGLAICGTPDLLINVFPVDMVVAQAVRIVRANPEQSIFHLVNATPPRLDNSLRVLFRELALKEPIFVASKAELSGFSFQFSRTIDFYGEYFSMPKIFERRQTNAVLGDAGSGDFPMDDHVLTEYVRWYLRTNDAGLPQKEKANDGSTGKSMALLP